MNLGIFCAGNLGKEVFDIAKRINEIEEKWDDMFFIDNFCEKTVFYGAKVYRLSEVDKNKTEIVIAAGEPSVRREIYDQVKKEKGKLVTIIDPTSIISPSATIGNGVIVTPYTSISSDVVIDDNVLIQSYIRVGHGIHIGGHSNVSANCAIGGETIIGNEVFIGMNSTIKGELNIRDKAIVSMGSVVFKDVERETLVAGNPARITLGNDRHRVFSK